jgi:hypothetical protein
MAIKSLVPPAFLETHEPGVAPVTHARPGVVIESPAVQDAAGMVEDMLYPGLVPDHDLCTAFGKELCRDADCERMGGRRVGIRGVQRGLEEDRFTFTKPREIVRGFQDDISDCGSDRFGAGTGREALYIDRFHSEHCTGLRINVCKGPTSAGTVLYLISPGCGRRRWNRKDFL